MDLKTRLMKPIGCLALAATLAFGQLPAFGASLAFADEGNSTAKDFSEADFKALGFNISKDTGSESYAPYSTTRPISIFTHPEVYTAANGAHGNEYVIRDGLDRLNYRNAHEDSHLQDKYGAIYGGGGFWNGINKFDDDKLKNNGNYGGGIESALSSNAGSNVLAHDGEGFSGIYAKSVEFSNTAGALHKANCIAELRAYGNKSTTEIEGSKYKGAVTVELMSVDASGKRAHIATLHPTVTAGQMYNGGFAYLDGGYLQCLEAYFDVEAADVDADGLDEIFVYCGAYHDQDGIRYALVNMFKSNGSSWECMEYALPCGDASNFSTKSLTSNCQGDFYMQNSPVVTFAAGDIDRNGSEDLAVTCSASYGHTNTAFAYSQVFTWNPQTAQMMQVDGIPTGEHSAINLASPDGKAMVSANCAFGSFVAYDQEGLPNGRTVEGLIIAGYESLGSSYTYSDNNYMKRFGYRFLYYDAETDEYKLSDYLSADLQMDGARISHSAAKDTSQGGRYPCTLAPLALCCANVTGMTDNGIHNDAVLVGGDVFSNFVCSLANNNAGINGYLGSMHIGSTHYNRSNHITTKGTEQVWIGDVVAGCVGSSAGSETQLYYGNFNESFLAVVGNHRDEDLRENDDYYWMDLSHFTVNLDGKIYSSEEEVISESNRKNPTYGTWISLCLPDIDDDAIILSYNSKEKTYTNPQVLAVLQDAPYYQDLQDAYDYLVLGGTGFGQEKSSGQSNGVAVDGAIGYAQEVEAGFLAGGRIAVEVQFQGSYEYEHVSTVSYAASFESHAGEGNKAVIYTLPIVYYFYDLYDQSSGKKGQVAFPVSLGYETSVVSLETLDQLCEKNGIDGVGKWLTNTSGLPSSYAAGPKDDSFGLGKTGVTRAYSGQSKMGCNSKAGASINQEISVEKEDNHAMEAGLRISAEVLGGGKCFGQEAFFGGAGEIAPGYTHMWISSKSTTFEGCVDNLPKAAGNDYGFQWRLGVNEVSMEDFKDKPVHEVSGDMDNFWIIGYEVEDVQNPEAPAVTGLTARAASDSSITLSWSEVPLAQGSTYRYGIGMVTNESTDDKPVVGSWRYADPGTTSLTWDNLESSSGYRFVMYLVDSNNIPQSIRTPVVHASTLPVNATFSIQGIDSKNTTAPLSSDSTLTVKEGDTLTLAALGLYDATGQGKADTCLTYTWYKKKRGEETWEVVRIATGETPDEVSTYTPESFTAEDNGTQYCCMASYNDYELTTNVIRITMQPAPAKVVTQTRRPPHKNLHDMISGNALAFNHRTSATPIITHDVDVPAPAEPGSNTGGTTLASTGDANGQVALAFALCAGLSLAVLVASRRRDHLR